MKKEHIESLLEVVQEKISVSEDAFNKAVFKEDDNSEIDAKEKELKKWIAIRLQLKEMTEEEPMIDINSIRRENILLRSILREMRNEVESIFEKRWLAR